MLLSSDSALVFPFDLVVYYLYKINPQVTIVLSKISFLLVAISFLPRHHVRVVDSDWLLYTKLRVAGLLCCIELLSCFVDETHVGHVAQGSLPITSSVLPWIVALGLIPIIKIEHNSTRKSTARLALWLTTSVLLDSHTLFRHLSHGNVPRPATSFLPAILGLKLFLLLLGELPKAPIVPVPKKHISSRLVDATSSAGFWTRSLFICLNPTIPSLYGDRAMVFICSQHLEETIIKIQLSGGSIWRSWLSLAFRKPFLRFTLSLAGSRLLLTACKLSQVTLLIRLLVYMREKDNNPDIRLALLSAAISVFTGLALSRCHFKGLCDNSIVLVRGVLVSAIHKKLLLVTEAQRQQAQLENMIDVHVDGFTNGISNIFDSIAIAIEFAVSIKWLFELAGYPTLFLVAVPSIYSFVVKYVRRGLPESEQALESDTAHRLKKTSSLISQIRAIRIARIDDIFSAAIEKLRLAEIARLVEIFQCKYGLATTNTVIWTCTGPVFFSILAWTSGVTSQDALVAHAALAVIAVFISAAMDAVRDVNKAKTMLECAANIQSFLLLEVIPLTVFPSQEEDRTARPRLRKEHRADRLIGLGWIADAVRLSDERHNDDTAAIHSQSQANNYVVKTANLVLTPHPSTLQSALYRVNLYINRFEIAIIAGPTGSGKSTFLRAILGQRSIRAGRMWTNMGLVGYCSQIPWLQHASIRENIIGYGRFEPHWYNAVVNACLLDQDFLQLANRDLSIVGNHGLNLSRGQRRRIALARALYLHASCLVLDDVFAGLSEQSRKDMFNRIFGVDSIWSQHINTVIMTTNSSELVKKADRAILVDSSGHVTMHTDQGAEFQSRLQSLGLPDDNNTLTRPQKPTKNVLQLDTNPFELSISKSKMNCMAACYAWISFLDYELVKRQLAYLTSAVVVIGFADIFTCLWLSVAPTGYLFLFSYWVISGLSCFLTIRAFMFWYLQFAPLSALDIHQRLLTITTQANLSFMTQFSYSSMLNLFDHELNNISEVLPIFFIRVIHQGGIFLVQLCLIAALADYSYLFLVVYISGCCLTLFWYLYLACPAQISDTKSRAAMRAFMTEMTTGVLHLKAFEWQQRALDQSNRLLVESQDDLYYSRCLDRWMYFTIEMSRSLASIIVVALVVIYQQPVPALAIGLMLVFPMKAEDSTQYLVEDCAILQSSLQTLGALLKFLDDAPRETGGASEDYVLDGNWWPKNGNIIFDDVTAKYNEKSSALPVLKNASFSLPAGYKIGVVGKSGSGKSSLLMAMLNFLDYTGDIKIDGISLSKLSHRQLRQHIITISQDRINMGGTVWSNLFPRQKASDSSGGIPPASTEVILKGLGLWKAVRACDGLDTEVSKLNLSDGQYRLLSVARGMLESLASGGNLVIMDDISGNLDPEMETAVINTLMDVFSSHTVIMEVSQAELLAHCDITINMVAGRVDSIKLNPNGPAAIRAQKEKDGQSTRAEKQEHVDRLPDEVTEPSLQQLVAKAGAQLVATQAARQARERQGRLGRAVQGAQDMAQDMAQDI